MLFQDRYLAVVLSGAAGEPSDDLDGKTALQAAPTPYLDALAGAAEVGCVELPERADPSRPETSVAALLGAERTSIPHGPLMGAALGVGPGDRDVCFRCEFVATDGEKLLGPTGRMPEAQERTLISLVQEKLSTRRLRVVPGDGGLHLIVWTEGPRDLECSAPEEAKGLPIRQALPRGDGEEVLRRFLDDCLNLLHDHPVNREREGDELPPAHLLWPYENGITPALRPFALRWGMAGGAVSTAPEVCGLARLLGMTVAGPTGADADYAAVLKAGLCTLRSHGFVLLHITTCRAAAQRGDATELAYTLRDLDTRLIARLCEAQATDGFRLLLVCDAAKASGAPMLYLLSPGETAGRRPPFDERIATDGGFPPVAAEAMMSKLLQPTSVWRNQ